VSFKKDERAALYFTMSDIVHVYRVVFYAISLQFFNKSKTEIFIFSKGS
jgi:hypothetical protein